MIQKWLRKILKVISNQLRNNMSVHEQWLQSLSEMKKQLAAKGVEAQLPPPSQVELQIEYLEVVPGKKIRGKVPFQKRFTNPIRTYQGGILSAAMDDHLG